MLSVPMAWVQSLVGELRSHKLRGTAKKKKTVNKVDTIHVLIEFICWRERHRTKVLKYS